MNENEELAEPDILVARRQMAHPCENIGEALKAARARSSALRRVVMEKNELEDLVPVITLWQPWASLIFSGHKRCETRSFAPPFKYVGKRIAIHAAARMPGRVGDELADLCYDAFGCGWNYSLPRGAILGTVTLGGFYPTEKLSPTADDRIAGDWSEGRYAWQLLDAEPLPSPLPAKGKQGWWRAPLPHQQRGQ